MDNSTSQSVGRATNQADTNSPWLSPNKPQKNHSANALLGSAVAGAALGVAAMMGRKAASQNVATLAGNWDDVLVAEHKAALAIFGVLEKTTGKNVKKRRMLLAQLKQALAKHALHEENVIYPALRDNDQAEGADHLNNDHGYVKQYLYELTNCSTESDRFSEIVSNFHTYLERHIEDEETELFPALMAKLSAAQNIALTAAMNKEGLRLA